MNPVVQRPYPASRARFVAWCRFACLALFASFPAAAQQPARSPASDIPRAGSVRAPLSPQESEGRPISLVFYDLTGASGITGGDAKARERIEQAFGLRVGGMFTIRAAEMAVQKVTALPFVRSAGIRLFDSEHGGRVVVAVSVEMGPQDGKPRPPGMARGRPGDFPILYQDERTLVRLQLDGGLGLYTEVNPWFGNAAAFTAASPIALDPARGGSATWYEMSAEYGLSAISQLGESPFWLYGAGSFLTSFSTGQDLFRSDTRDMTRLEDLYGGVAIGTTGSDWSASLSAGRQNWQLNDGFLFSRFAAGANAGSYPGLYLNPRTAYEMTALAQMKWKDLKLEGFYLDPAELETLDSNSTYAGAHLAYDSPDGLAAALLYYESPESDTVFPNPATGGTVPREGLQVVDGRLGSTRAFGIPGWELSGEYAWQTHREVDWDANAWYVRTGYTFRDLPWSPNLSYRYASFSGDDPATRTYERFDAQLSSGLDAWVQGVNAKKVVSNSNLNSHRIRLNLIPTQKLSLTFDYFQLRADESRGSDLYAHEWDLGVRWNLTSQLFFLGVAGIAIPGENLKQRAGGDLDRWVTVQGSLFWFF